MAFTAADVKNLREMTGVGMMDCKKALTASDGDMDKAVEFLREKGLAASAKKAGRVAAEGMAYAAVIDGVGVVVEVNAETDFVGKNEKFVDFVKGVAATVAANKPADLEALMACKYNGTDLTVEQQQQEMVLVIGENIKVRRFAIFTEGVSVPYIHAGAKLGFDADDKKAEADADAAYAQAKETVLAELRQTFRPEFLNRIDDIIVFRALTEQNIEEVARRMLKTVADRMETMDIHLDASDEAVKELAKEGFDPKYGARPLRRAIQSKVEDAVAEKMLDGTLKTGDTAKLAVEDDKLVVTK